MPHLHVREFKTKKLPFEENGVLFGFAAHNTNHQEESLISVKVDEDEFFLLLKDEDGKKLLKSDKLTRPSSIYNVHKALLAYAKALELDIISSNVVEREKNIHLQEVSALKDIEYFAKSFPSDKDICIEIGFGSGRHLLHQASNNPDMLFIGIEIHHPSIEQLLKHIAIKKLDNILVLNYDARLFMEFVPSNIVERIFVHFPVPWDKKPHRRVVSRSFVEESRRVLKQGGTLELRTDSQNYYDFSYETFISFDKAELHIKKNMDIAISSKYEDRWKRMQKNIYDLTMINDEFSPDLSLEGGFEFENGILCGDDILKLHKQVIKFDSGFVHFERIYALAHGGFMIRISMGSFDKPEHAYVVIEETEIKYFRTIPLKSKSNLKAHQLLKRVLHG